MTDWQTLLDQAPHEELLFLPDRSSREEIAAQLVALANQRGGTMLIGMTKGGLVNGLADPDEMEQRALAALLLTEPPMVGGVVQIEAVEFEGLPLLKLTLPDVMPSIYQLNGRYLQRIGTETIVMSTAALRAKILARRETPFEQQVPQGATAGDLSRSAIEQYLAHLQEYDEGAVGEEQRASELLRRRGVLRSGDGRPTYAGLLLFGRQPQQWLPSAQILIARYADRQMNDIFLRQQIGGPLPQQIRQAEAFLVDNMRRGVRMSGLQRQEQLEYPREAVCEAIVNAVAHRDYAIRGSEIQIFIFSDRIEFLSPGRLPGHVTIDNILEERFSRNERLVQMLSDLGFIERLGYGIDRILTLATQYKLPRPKLEETANGFRLTLYGAGDALSQQTVAAPPITTPKDRLAPYRAMGLNPRQLEAVGFVIADGRITNSDFRELVPEVSAETLRRDLADMVDRGILLKVGERKATYYILK